MNTKYIGLRVGGDACIIQSPAWHNFACSLQNKMVAMERISQYLNLPREAPEV